MFENNQSFDSLIFLGYQITKNQNSLRMKKINQNRLVGCGTVEDGKKLRSERVIDFDHVDGSRDLPRVSGDDEGLSWPRICHGVRGARVLERVFLGSLHNRRSFSAWQL